MKKTTGDFFDKAERLLAEADIMLEVGLFEAAGRNAYLAGCHAARGLLFEHNQQISNRHQRLWGDLTQVLHTRGINDYSLTSFLPNLYSLKRVADYESGSSEITQERAEQARSAAAYYVKQLLELAQTF
jgi:uncharacterized protein (UPF0332 family)